MKILNDIDVALYLSSTPAAPLEYELSLEAAFSDVIQKYPVDVRILNVAPLSFRYNVIKEGVLLIVRDDERRTGFHRNERAGLRTDPLTVRLSGREWPPLYTAEPHHASRDRNQTRR